MILPSLDKESTSSAGSSTQAYQKQVDDELGKLPPSVLALAAFTLGSVTTIGVTLVYARYGKRLQNSNWVTPDILAKRKWVKGVVTSVGDGDNFRLYHTPGFGWRWPLKFRRVPASNKDLKDQTIHIRIAGVDAPEAAHFGKPAQPYAAESLAWMRETVLGRRVYCQMIRKDQYSRIVSTVVIAPRILPGMMFSGKNVSIEMLKAGWGTVYEQTGAEYGKYTKEEMQGIEASARAAKRGMWQSGQRLETPAEYKRRHAQAKTLEEAEAARPDTKAPTPKKGLLQRLFGSK